MDPADRNRVGIIGAGRLGQAMARTALRAGRSVIIANSRGPASPHDIRGLGAGCWSIGKDSGRHRQPASSSSRCPGAAFRWPSKDSNGTVRS